MREDEIGSELLKMQPKLQRYANLLTCDREKAKDLLQNTNLKTLEHAEMFEAGTNFQAFTFTVMYRLFINDLKKWSRMVFTPDIEIVRQNYTGSNSYDPVEKYEIREAIDKRLDGLPENDKNVWRLYEEGYPYEEISKMTGILLGTVKSKIHSIKKKLKSELGVFNLS